MLHNFQTPNALLKSGPCVKCRKFSVFANGIKFIASLVKIV